MRLVWVARSLLVAVFPPVLLSQEEKGGVGVSTPDVPEPSASSSSSSTSAAFQVGILFKFFGSMENHYIQQVCAEYGLGSPSSA